MEKGPRVELFERIRRDNEREGLSIRALADRHGVHRRAVRQALASAVPPGRKTPQRRRRPVLGEHEHVIRRWLREDLDAPPKQRHTAHRVWQRLVTERGARVAESTVREYVRRVRRELAEERLPAVTIAQEHPPGAEAEVDFGEFRARVARELLVLWLFIMRLSYSAHGFAAVFAHQAQEAFFEGHVLAFEHFDGVPCRIRYDNLKPAVTRVLIGRDRVQNERFIALRSHHLFDTFFCMPGVEGAHEKGGVEGEVGRFRRNHLVPVPEVADMDELRALIQAGLAADDRRRVTGRAQTVGEAFAIEQAALKPLPAERFDTRKELTAKVDAKARICVLQAHYSVPARYAGRRVAVRLGAEDLHVHDASTHRLLAVWPRGMHKRAQHLALDHYLEILMRKPGALPGSVALAQARAAGVFTEAHQSFWDTARRQAGDADGARRMCEVLLLHRRMSPEEVIAGMRAALKVDSTDPALVAVEARRAVEHSPAVVLWSGAGRVEDDTPGPNGYHRPAPTLTGYDQLLDANSQEVPSG